MKQETLEEAAEKFAKSKTSHKTFQETHKRDFIEGAKWKSERMYSEEEVGKILYNAFGEYGKHYDIMIDGALINKLFEQFKNK
jgi:hypothetical protein